MSWKNVVCSPSVIHQTGGSYKVSETDKAARVVLKALGIGPRDLGYAEKCFLHNVFRDECMWSRAARLFSRAVVYSLYDTIINRSLRFTAKLPSDIKLLSEDYGCIWVANINSTPCCCLWADQSTTERGFIDVLVETGPVTIAATKYSDVNETVGKDMLVRCKLSQAMSAFNYREGIITPEG